MRVFIALLFGISCLHAAVVDVYFGTGGRNAGGIYRAKFNTVAGKLSKVALAAEVGSPGFLAFHPSRNYLYAVGRMSDEAVVVAYQIKADGSLHYLNSTLIGDGSAAHISVHPSGDFLITAQYSGGSVAVFPLAENGQVQPRAQLLEHSGGSGIVPKRQNSPHPHWTGFSPDGRFAFVPDLGLDQIVIYEVRDVIKPDLVPVGAALANPGAGPRHMKFSVDGQYIYLLNELSLSVTTFAYDSSAGLTRKLTTTPALDAAVKLKESFNSASEIVVHPSGKFAYSGNRGNDSVTVYRIDPDTGELRVVEVESIRGAWPRNINLDATGHWLLAAGAHSNTVSVFAVDQTTGELQYQRNRIVNVPGAICILLND